MSRSSADSWRPRLAPPSWARSRLSQTAHRRATQRRIPASLRTLSVATKRTRTPPRESRPFSLPSPSPAYRSSTNEESTTQAVPDIWDNLPPHLAHRDGQADEGQACRREGIGDRDVGVRGCMEGLLQPHPRRVPEDVDGPAVQHQGSSFLARLLRMSRAFADRVRSNSQYRGVQVLPSCLFSRHTTTMLISAS